MPYTKPFNTEKIKAQKAKARTEKENRVLIANIHYFRNLYGMSYDSLATAIGRKRTTLFRRLRNPDEFTLKELRGMAELFCVPLEKLIKVSVVEGISA